jgi:hypothetical protein
MANSTTTNPIYLDTFSGDVTISTGPIIVKSIVFGGGSANDTLVLEDAKGVWCVRIKCPTAGDTKQIDFGPEGQVFQNGLICDVSDGAYNTAYAFIYL